MRTSPTEDAQTNPMIELQRRLSVHWPLWIALAVLWMLTVTFEYLATLRTQGKLIYTLDDAYIHMAMAKNIALHGVYGVTRYEFSSSSSSPLWTLLLGLFYWTFGVRETLPLVLDLLISSAALGAVYFTLRRKIANNYWMALILLAVVVLTPMPVLISSGMEHPLHIVLVILFAGLFGKTMDDDEALRKPSNVIFLCLLCAGLVMTRFESYAIVFIAVVFTLFRGRWKTAFGMAASAVLPLVVYQAISVAHGSRWLPNSILIRGDVHHTGIFNSAESVLFVPLSSPNFGNFILGWWHGFILAPYLGALVGASALVLAISWFRSKKFWKSEHVLLLTYVAAAAAHLQFGRTGHFYRYDAYLVTLGIFVLSIPLSEVFASLVRWMVKNVSRTLIGSVAILLSLQMLFPLMTRSFLAFPLIPAASRNIYEQQYQMGLFLKRYYQGKAVAANDIGAITFLA
ncbi:MAG TPA: hypothetical protein VI758_10045, partial [Bacteroidota bacterium]